MANLLQRFFSSMGFQWYGKKTVCKMLQTIFLPQNLPTKTFLFTTFSKVATCTSRSDQIQHLSRSTPFFSQP